MTTVHHRHATAPVDIEDGAAGEREGKEAEGFRLANDVQMPLAQDVPVHVVSQVDGRDGDCGSREVHEVFAGPRLAQRERQEATAALAPLLDVPRAHRVWVVAAFLLGAITGDALGDPDAVARAVERALDLAEAGKMLFPFLAQPAPALPDHQARHRASPAALISEAVELLAGAGRAAPPGGLTRPCGPLTEGETRVLRYLPSNLSAREIADELYLSMNTVKTHQRHLYRKLGACTRTQAVERARALGLLAPSSRRS